MSSVNKKNIKFKGLNLNFEEFKYPTKSIPLDHGYDSGRVIGSSWGYDFNVSSMPAQAQTISLEEDVELTEME